MPRRVWIALLVPIILAARCSEPEPDAPPVATPLPDAPAAAAPPTTAPVPPEPENTGTPAPPDQRADELPANRWLHIERLYEHVEGGWVTGHNPTPNRIILETQNVAQFSMDVSRLQLDWGSRVWVRINQQTFELTHKLNPVIHLRETLEGVWEVIEPQKE
ncbi:MAG: hypothetical protein V2A79_04815 [Planctomycetota bacterium]